MTLTAPGPSFSKTAPAGLAQPDDIVTMLEEQDRAHFILEHGCTAEELEPGWWLRAEVEIRLPGG